MKAFFRGALLLVVVASTTAAGGTPEPRVIEVIAASDNTFRVLHEKSPVIRAKPGELLRLRITSQPGRRDPQPSHSHPARSGLGPPIVRRYARVRGKGARDSG